MEEYCYCKLHIPGSKMIFCSGKNCPNIWYHLECIDMEENDVPDGKWFCGDICKNDKSRKRTRKRASIGEMLIDRKQVYAINVMWHGLQQMVRKDAIRENHGPRIILHWKFDMLKFIQNHHPKYFLVGHRLLSNVNGAESLRLQQTLTWNRTVNINGGDGNNISMDLQMEFYNKEYKDASGQLTTATVERHSQMVGVGVGKEIRKIFETQVSVLKRNLTHGKTLCDRSNDICEFLKIMNGEDIFNTHPGRCFVSFPAIDIDQYDNVVSKSFRNREGN